MTSQRTSCVTFAISASASLYCLIASDRMSAVYSERRRACRSAWAVVVPRPASLMEVRRRDGCSFELCPISAADTVGVGGRGISRVDVVFVVV